MESVEVLDRLSLFVYNKETPRDVTHLKLDIARILKLVAKLK